MTAVAVTLLASATVTHGTAFIVGLLGFAVTFAIAQYDLRNMQIYDAAIHRAKELEKKLSVPACDKKTEGDVGGLWRERPRAPVKKFKRRSEAQQKATGNEPEHANCGRQRTDGDRRGFCGVRDTGRVGLAIVQHGPVYAPLPPVRVIWPVLAGFADVGATR